MTAAVWGTPPPNKERPTSSHARQHLEQASDWIKTCFARLANCAGYRESYKVWLYHPTCTKWKSLKLQSPWEGPLWAFMQIHSVVYGIQWNHRLRAIMVHLD
jgi:hypothetical protein